MPTIYDMANAIRALSIDAVEQARSGHLGMPLGMADVATVLYTEFLRFDAGVPDWSDRDRFVLSAGHGSMLQYAILYLSGNEHVTLDEIRNFRQLGSLTPGHPENFVTPGVEATTGPLGQGLATAVGMAIAERHLNARFGDELVNHKTYVLAGDGCLMEGISQEAISLAGRLKLSNLIVLFDDNAITIDGGTDLADATDQIARFEASGWRTYSIDGHNPEEIRRTLTDAQGSDRPVLIACRTQIGFGAPTLAGTNKAHGGPYGEHEATGIKKALDWPHAPFEVPAELLTAWRDAGRRGQKDRSRWQQSLEASPLRDDFLRTMSGNFPSLAKEAIAAYKEKTLGTPKATATRKWSGAALEVLTEEITPLIGGSADLTGSNNTKTKHTQVMSPDNWAGRYINYGVREFGMAAAMNGMSLHGGVIPYAGTFLVFSDYSRAAIRLAALMGTHVIHVMTHDSIGLGEDGPTHQPVEHLSTLRVLPGLHVFRPADGIEVIECWEAALARTDGPSLIALSRQEGPPVRLKALEENKSQKGGYVLRDAHGAAQIVLIGTGTEVSIALEAREILQAEGIGTRVVSMPSFELFAQQTNAYREDVLGGDLPKVAIEAGVRFGWDQWIGRDGGFVGMTSFGASAPAATLYEHFGITAQEVVKTVRQRLD